MTLTLKRHGVTLPLGTLRDWEQHKSEPDAAARVLLRVIAHDPEVVAAAVKRET